MNQDVKTLAFLARRVGALEKKVEQLEAAISANELSDRETYEHFKAETATAQSDRDRLEEKIDEILLLVYKHEELAQTYNDSLQLWAQ